MMVQIGGQKCEFYEVCAETRAKSAPKHAAPDESLTPRTRARRIPAAGLTPAPAAAPATHARHNVRQVDEDTSHHPRAHPWTPPRAELLHKELCHTSPHMIPKRQPTRASGGGVARVNDVRAKM